MAIGPRKKRILCCFYLIFNIKVFQEYFDDLISFVKKYPYKTYEKLMVKGD